MPIDASIPLSVRGPDVMNPRELVSLQDMVQKTRYNQEEIQKKRNITQILQSPGAIDPQSGRVSLAALGAITQQMPEMGLQLGAQQESLRLRDLQINERKQQLQMSIEQAYVEDYDRLLQSTGGNKEEARRQAIANRNSSIEEMFRRGQFSSVGISEDDVNRIRATVRDPDQVRTMVTAMGGQISSPAAPRERKRIVGDQEVQEEFDPVSRTWREIGKGPRFKPETAGGAFEGKNGELLAALAERGVSLPAGFRSKAQQIGLLNSLRQRNPSLSPDEIAEKVKGGQISFGSEKKETQVAAGVAGRVAVAAEEITQFAPLVEKASLNVPRGSFVPVNKLLQTADRNISDPNLKQLKIQINSLLNAYDQLAARGGTDKDKRAEAHSLLTSAESHEALMSGLDAFKKEVVAAQRAADIASRPRSERDAARKQGGSDWVDRAMKANPGMSREEVEAEGRRLGKI